MKLGLIIFAGGKNTVSYQNMVMDVGVEITAEAMDEGNRSESSPSRGVRAALPYGGFHRPQEHPE